MATTNAAAVAIAAAAAAGVALFEVAEVRDANYLPAAALSDAAAQAVDLFLPADPLLLPAGLTDTAAASVGAPSANVAALPRPARALLIFVHGGAWRTNSRSLFTDLARRFAAAGVACAVVGYRLTAFASSSSSTVPAAASEPAPLTVRHPDHVKDVAAAVAFLLLTLQHAAVAAPAQPASVVGCPFALTSTLAALADWSRRINAAGGDGGGAGTPVPVFLAGHSVGATMTALLSVDTPFLGDALDAARSWLCELADKLDAGDDDDDDDGAEDREAELQAAQLLRRLAAPPAETLRAAVRGVAGAQGIYHVPELVARFPTYAAWFVEPALGPRAPDDAANEDPQRSPWAHASPALHANLYHPADSPSAAPAFLVLHGPDDELVDAEQAALWVARLRGPLRAADVGVVDRELAGVSHDDVLTHPAYFKAVTDWLLARLP
ncbi:Kynurenine formamidase [Cladochytrium tenue]|nr:Kynurenine formamidase [Cladochytrium tenue]